MSKRGWRRLFGPWRAGLVGLLVAALPSVVHADDGGQSPSPFGQITGSLTATIAHDSRVRHRTTVPANGSDTTEVCDVNFISDSGDEDASSIDTEEDCEEVEVPAGAQSRTALANIEDWQASALAKFDHRLNFDSRGDTWHSLLEISEAWQAIASDQDIRVIKLRTGPSFLIPLWQTKLDIGGAYQNNRFNHANALDVYSPVAAVETKPFAGFRGNATYAYEIRHATPVSLIGGAQTGDLQARWDLTKLDRITLRTLLRSQTTRSTFSGYDSAEFRITYRRGFAFFGAAGWYGEIEPRLRLVDFAAPSSNAADNGLTRHDRVWSAVLTLGRDFNTSWTLLGSYTYGYTASNLIRFRHDDNRLLSSLVRNF